MSEYAISYCAGQPDWSKLPTLEMTYAYRKTPENIRAFGQFAWDEQALHVHLQIETKQIRAVEKGPYGMPCQDSCLEFFFCPVPGDPRYLNIEFNFNGCMYLGMGTSLKDLTRLIPDQEENPFSPQIQKTETGWEIFYRIPYSFIRRFFPTFAPIPGMTIRANCYTCSDLSDEPYYKSWSEVSCVPFTFHCTESFGFMIFSNL